MLDISPIQSKTGEIHMAKKEVSKDKVNERLKDYKQSISVSVEGQGVVGTIREFSTGSIGYNVNGKVVIDGHKCQVTGNIVIVGSKPESKSEKK